MGWRIQKILEDRPLYPNQNSSVLQGNRVLVGDRIRFTLQNTNAIFRRSLTTSSDNWLIPFTLTVFSDDGQHEISRIVANSDPFSLNHTFSREGTFLLVFRANIGNFPSGILVPVIETWEVIDPLLSRGTEDRGLTGRVVNISAGQSQRRVNPITRAENEAEASRNTGEFMATTFPASAQRRERFQIPPPPTRESTGAAWRSDNWRVRLRDYIRWEIGGPSDAQLLDRALDLTRHEIELRQGDWHHPLGPLPLDSDEYFDAISEIFLYMIGNRLPISYATIEINLNAGNPPYQVIEVQESNILRFGRIFRSLRDIASRGRLVDVPGRWVVRNGERVWRAGGRSIRFSSRAGQFIRSASSLLKRAFEGILRGKRVTFGEHFPRRFLERVAHPDGALSNLRFADIQNILLNGRYWQETGRSLIAITDDAYIALTVRGNRVYIRTISPNRSSRLLTEINDTVTINGRVYTRARNPFR